MTAPDPLPCRRPERGFSLLELIVVMSILAVIGGMALPTVGKSVQRARVADTRRELNNLEVALTAYFEDTLAFPASFDGLEHDPGDVPGWAGPYLRTLSATSVGAGMSLTEDAWEQPYHVKLSAGVELTITSPGADGTRSTDDDIVLIVDVTPVLRRSTRAELSRLNSAVASYNAEYLPDAPLPQDIDALVERLQDSGLLPAGLPGPTRDAWGSLYAPVPPDEDPVVLLGSPHLPSEED